VTLIFRSHVTLCSEKKRINIAVRGRVQAACNEILSSPWQEKLDGSAEFSMFLVMRKP
jgi:hypothetical protein